MATYNYQDKALQRKLGSGEHRISLLSCPVCQTPMLSHSLLRAGQEHFAHSVNSYRSPTRLWPKTHVALDQSIPGPVRRSIEDARKCYLAGVYSAAAVMCGRALEYVTVEKTGEKTLYKGLQKLREQNQIDDRLLDWSNALRNERNMGAHAMGQETTP